MLAAETRIATSADRQLATFWLGDLLLGIDIQDIREIIRVGDLTPVPDAPAMVSGVVNLRGDVVTVVNLRTVLDLPQVARTSQTRLMIVQHGPESIGLLVDRVADVVMVSAKTEEPLPANVGGVDGRYFTGVYRVGSELLVVLDVAAALTATEN
uniref:Chemotaxis protein CheW n=1 Tax=Schlesneria paludicola TaxID=360056 RepID=A0A7C2NWA3_9PLAN